MVENWIEKGIEKEFVYYVVCFFSFYFVLDILVVVKEKGIVVI